MNSLSRAVFTGFFLAVLFALPAVTAEREAETGEKARGGPDLPQGDSQQAKVIKEGKQNLDEIRRMLEEIQNDLADKKTGGATQKQQKAVVKKMNQLIDKIAEECSRGGKSGGGQPQQAKSSGQQKQGQQKGQQQQGEERKNQDQVKSSRQQQEAEQQRKEEQARKSKAQDGKEQPGKVANKDVADGEKPENSPGELANRISKGKKWGILPPKIREAIGSVNPKTAPSEYLEIIRSYYRRISEQYAERKK
ncbi:MAG: hypothetical protein VYB34_15745 [Planctomycetota bacterium]|nr:hypothetical protein [Planctomycetota bacterium]MEE3055185.1 hypothetical protein [Planctomycetota bacterium]